MKENKRKQEKLNENLWEIATNLRGDMTINQYKDYTMGSLFYRYLSESVEEVFDEIILDDEISYDQAWDDKELREKISEELLDRLGYIIEPNYLFSSIIESIYNEPAKDFDLNYLSQAVKRITESTVGHESEKFFKDIFDYMDPSFNVLEKRVEDRTNLIVSILILVNEIDYSDEMGPGLVYSHLVERFAENGGLDIAESYTPREVSDLLARIVTSGKDKLRDVYDPTCGSASLMLEVNKRAKVDKFYGQELKSSISNLAKMNILINGVDYRDIDIRSYDIIENPRHLGKRFEAIVSNPPFGERWSKDEKFKEDERFVGYPALAPKSRADYVFIQHMLHHLADDGVMAVIMPHGVLFRSGRERDIRRYLIEEKNYLDAVIGLPENLFYDTAISTVLLVYKKSRSEDDPILFIDASKGFLKDGSRNVMREECVDRIVELYENRETLEKYSSMVSSDEIAKNDYNLNIPRYVDSFEAGRRISKEEAETKLKEIDDEIKKIDEEIALYLNEFGVKI